MLPVKLEVAVKAYRALSQSHFHNRTVSGTLTHDDFVAVKKNLEDNGLLINSQTDKNWVEFSLPIEDDAIFSLSLSDLLSAPSRQIQVPSYFYIADIDHLHDIKTHFANNKIKDYVAAASLAQQLIELSDYSVTTGNIKAIFLHGEKLELSLNYGAEDLKPLPELENFTKEFVRSELHSDQKATIIKSVLFEMLQKSEIRQFTLPSLLERFNEFTERVKANYQLYVSEFSFEKIKEKVEKEVFDFTIKLNNVISGIQNQLLAIPVALILIGSQMKQSDSVNITNSLIFCSSIFFAGIMSLLIRNQKSTLSAIKLEISSQWDEIRRKHIFTSERLGEQYRLLHNRHRNQSVTLLIVDFLVSISILISAGMFLYNSDTLSAWKEVITYGVPAAIIYLILLSAAAAVWDFIFSNRSTL